MICDWCGHPIDSYAQHFASYAGQPCKFAALDDQPVLHLDSGLGADSAAERARIRNRTIRDLGRTGHRDRLEGKVATNSPASQDPQGRT